MRKYLFIAAFTACLLVNNNTSFAQKTESALYQQTSEVNNWMVQYDADNKSINRFYLIKNSPERRTRLQKLNKDYLVELEKMNFDKLPVGIGLPPDIPYL